MADRPVRVWVLFHSTTQFTHIEPDKLLEGYPSVLEAEHDLAIRMRTGNGHTRYVHPDNQPRETYTVWPEHDDTCSVSVWLARDLPHQGEPDAMSQPHERWTLTPRGAVRREPF